MTTDPHPERGPGHDAALRGRNAIEEALLLLPTIEASLDRTGLRDRLLRAIHCAYLALDTALLSVAHIEALGQAAAGAEECRVMFDRARAAEPSPGLDRSVDWLDQAARALREGYDAVARIQYGRRSELHAGNTPVAAPSWRPFRASVGVPSLHAMARAPLLPHIFVEPAGDGSKGLAAAPMKLPRPATLEDLAAFAEAAASGAIDQQIDEATAAPPPSPAAPPPEAWAYEPAVEEAEVLRRLARDCLEDIAGHRMLRKPNVMETWLDQGPFEQRMLDNLDAFVALGGAVLPQVALYQAEAKSPDPERAFAMALVLGAIEGGDAVAAAVMAFKQSAPETYPGWLEGFWLAPSPAIDVAMADLATTDRPAWIAFALDVLHQRGRTPDDLVRRHASSLDGAVLASVARALATSLPRDEAVPLLSRLVAAPLADEVLLAALRSLLVRGHGPAIAWLREVAAGEPTSDRARRALWLLSLVGSASDLDLLLRGVEVATPGLVRGLGRFGHAGAFPRLVELLSNDDAEVVESAAEALDRITGAGQRETVEEPWEVDIPKELLDEGIPIPTRKRQRVVIDPAAWSSWLARPQAKLDPKQRLRGGVPLTPGRIVAELESPSTPAPRRDEAAEELALLLGHEGPFSTGDWVPRQRELLRDLRARASASAAPAGAWGFGWDARHTTAAAPAPSPAPSPSEPSLPAAAPPAPTRELPSFMKAAAVPPAAETPGAAPSPAGTPPPRPAAPPRPPPRPPVPPGAPATPPHDPGATPKPKERLDSTAAWDAGALRVALPFLPKSQPAAATPPEKPGNQLGSTRLANDEMRRAVLPFALRPQVGKAPPPPPPPPRKPAPPEETLDDSTLEPAPSPIKAALPFQRNVLPGRAEVGRIPAAELPAAKPGRPPAPAIPAIPAIPSGASPGWTAGDLTLDDHASMCAELTVFRDRAEGVFAKYGLADAKRRAAADASWKARLLANPAEKAEWEQLYRQYEAHWRRRL